ncbi:hypothetical protein JTL57_37665, partial [Pseudomonas aeruginosa]|nr:hypothetical protein [Pseudomonas aeruginosa]
SRMNAVKAKGLITCDGFYRRGRLINTMRTAFEAAEKCPTIEKLIPVSSAGKESRMKFHRTMSKFLYAMHSLYPGIELREVIQLQSSISQNINFG